MDTYHEILVRLYEATGGRENKSVDFKDLVKKAGFLGNYLNIFQRLNEEGWIAEDLKADYVRISPWGIAEAKKAQTPLTEEEQAAIANAKNLAAAAKDFADASASYAISASPENFTKLESKFTELESTFKAIKS